MHLRYRGHAIKFLHEQQQGRGTCNHFKRLLTRTNITSTGHHGRDTDRASMLLLYEHGDFDYLSHSKEAISTDTYVNLLKVCKNIKSLHYVKQIRAHINIHGTDITGFLGDYLVMTLAKCGGISDAFQLCQSLPWRTVYSWTAIVSAYAESCLGYEALYTYMLMKKDGVEPNTFTFVSLFKACGSIPDLHQGKRLHAEAYSRGYARNIFIGNSLISMYGKCGSVVDAEGVFGSLDRRDIVSWNAMLSVYVEQDQGLKALLLFRQMLEEQTDFNPQTMVLALQAFGVLVEEAKASGNLMKQTYFEVGQTIHAMAYRKGYTSDIFVGTGLVHMYGNLGAAKEVEHAYNDLSSLDVIAWTALLSAYVDLYEGEKALKIFRLMQENGTEPNLLTFVIALQACNILWEKEVQVDGCDILSLEIGKAIHLDANYKGHTTDPTIANPLISMYGNCCGTVLEAENVFSALLQPDIVSWNAMLSAYVKQGQAEKAINLYKRMQKEDVLFNDLTLVSVLQACSQNGSLDFCHDIHCSAIVSGYDQGPLVRATIIHCYGSCADMVDAQASFNELTNPSLTLWNAFICGYAIQGSLSSIKKFEELQMEGMRPDEVTFTLVLSTCSHAGSIVEGSEHFLIMRNYDLIQDPKHYSIMTDLFGRSGNFKYMSSTLDAIPEIADMSIWLSVLGACRIHGHVLLARKVFEKVACLFPEHAAAHVLMSNICINEDLEDDDTGIYGQRCTPNRSER